MIETQKILQVTKYSLKEALKYKGDMNNAGFPVCEKVKVNGVYISRHCNTCIEEYERRVRIGLINE